MTEAPGAERRRTPRIALGRESGKPEVVLPVSITVQVLDLSQGGALFAAAEALEVGQRAQLRTRIGAEPLTVQIECRRVSPGRHPQEAARIGARFTSLDDDGQRKIDAFLNGEA